MTFLLTLALAACGSADLCDRSAEFADECGAEYSDADLQTCKEAIAKCNGKDRKILDEYVDCLDDGGFFSCSTDDSSTPSASGDTGDNGFEELGDILLCVAPLTDLSDDCLQSMDVEF